MCAECLSSGTWEFRAEVIAVPSGLSLVFPFVLGRELSNFRAIGREQLNHQCSLMACACTAVRIIIAGLSPQYLPAFPLQRRNLKPGLRHKAIVRCRLILNEREFLCGVYLE